MWHSSDKEKTEDPWASKHSCKAQDRACNPLSGRRRSGNDFFAFWTLTLKRDAKNQFVFCDFLRFLRSGESGLSPFMQQRAVEA